MNRKLIIATAAVATFAAASLGAQHANAATVTHPSTYTWSPTASHVGTPGVWELDDTHFGHTLRMVFQGSDGNLVEYVDGHAVWASGTANKGAATLNFQGSDGNVVIRNNAGAALFSFGAIYDASIRSLVDHVTMLPLACGNGTERMAGVEYFNDGTDPQWVPQLSPARC